MLRIGGFKTLDARSCGCHHARVASTDITIRDRLNWGAAALFRPPAPIGTREITIPSAGGSIEICVPDEFRPRLRGQLMRDSRSALLKARMVANKATLAYTLGGSNGGTIATGGIVAIATGAGPVSLAGIAITAIGAVVTGAGLWVAHRLNSLRAMYDYEIDLLRDAVEELR